MRAWSVKILDVLEDVVHASLHVGERLIDRLVARDRGGGFLADDGFDRELAADLFRERRRGGGDLGERGPVRQRAPFGAVEDSGERGHVAGEWTSGVSGKRMAVSGGMGGPRVIEQITHSRKQ